ncbi:MAG: amino acid adenylation domain-containing protein, partial [Gammaproteobacteria bacterium]|nr:amino acid adenylation domain-containing protein [Gammaproteobacteria bacterium]
MTENKSEKVKLQAVNFDPFADGDIFATFPATESQREIWVAAQLGEDSNCAYNESISLHFHGPLNIEAFKHAVQQLVNRHESLHANFSADGATFCVIDKLEIKISVSDLSSADTSVKKQQLQHLLDNDVEAPFNLESGPLFRVHLVLLSENESYAIICAHHIICDGLSWAVLLPDLADFYEAEINKVESALPTAELFSDYIKYLDSNDHKKLYQQDLKYWLDVFSDRVPQLELPTDQQRPKLKTYRAGRIDYSLNPAMVGRLKKLGSSAGATFVVTFMAAFKIFLYRLSGQKDIVLGLMAAGQSVSGFNNLVGHCVNLLPVRSQLQDSMSFEDYVKTLRGIMFDAFDHQNISFGSILKNLNIPRDPARIPLCPVTFNIDQAATGFPFGELKVDFITNDRHFENFEIFLNAVEGTNDQLTLECTFNSDLFSLETIQRRLEELECLISQIIENPQQAINNLELLPAIEQSLLDSWNETKQPMADGLLIHHLIEQQAVNLPDKTAVICGDINLSYSELNARANQLAHYLSEQNVKPDSLIGLAIDRSEHMLIAMLGILKAGAAYVPLDVDYPSDRLNYMIENSGLVFIVTQSQHQEKFEAKSKCLYIDDDSLKLNKKASSNLTISIQDSQLAYVIYTSGSTGKPKGVEVTQRCVVNFLNSMAIEPGMQTDDVMMAVTTLSFDIAVLELLLPLSVGATTVIAPRAVSIDGELLIESIERNQITLMQATPSTWRLLLDAGWQGNKSMKLLCGGEAFPLDLAKDLVGKVSSVWNMYGPTETTIWSTCHQIKPSENIISIGKPIANTQVYTLNDAYQLMPIGVQGELYIGGEGVVRGYLNNTALTQDRFINIRGKRLYRTGDLAKLHSNGLIECLGRVDNQVKLRGFRIELGEIESIILLHDSIKEVVVDVKELSVGDKRLIAYIVLKNEAQLDTNSLKTLCQSELPEYMIPQHFVPLEKLPLTLNGKIDRKSLPVEEITNEKSEQEIIEAKSDTEIKLANIWKTVLKRDQVSMTDNFFNLGGHSLLANQIITRIRKELNVSIPLTYLFEFPTLQLMSDNLPGDADLATLLPPGIEQRPVPFPASLSMTQQRLWFLQQLYPDSALFNQIGVWRLNGKIDRAIFTQAVSELVKRQLILKTRVTVIDGTPMMVEKEIDHTFVDDDFEFSSQDARDQELLQHIEKMAELPLNFESGHFLKIQLIELDPELYVMLVISHPIIWDGWSFDILLQEMSSIYLSLQDNKPTTLKPLPINYMDFPEWHKKWMSSGIERNQLAFWQKNLEGASTHINLPRDRQRPGLPTYQGNRESLFLKQDFVKKITDLAHAEGVTLYMVLLSAFYELLNQYSGQQDITIATQVQGRVRPEFENILGPFVNTILLRFKNGQDISHRQIIQSVRKTCVDAFNHQDVPFEKVLDEVGLTRIEKNAPPYQIMFTYQDTTNRSHKFADLKLSQINHNVHTAY